MENGYKEKLSKQHNVDGRRQNVSVESYVFYSRFIHKAMCASLIRTMFVNVITNLVYTVCLEIIFDIIVYLILMRQARESQVAQTVLS